MIYVRYAESPLGWIEMKSDGESLVGLHFVTEKKGEDSGDAVLLDTERQLAEYFGKWRESFDLPLRPTGTDFQMEIWRSLGEVPYGQTLSYQALAEKVGRSGAVRAVGAANARNPLAIVIPCHRVVGSNGKLTGYAGGLWRKEWLLEHEGARLGLSEKVAGR